MLPSTIAVVPFIQGSPVAPLQYLNGASPLPAHFWDPERTGLLAVNHPEFAALLYLCLV